MTTNPFGPIDHPFIVILQGIAAVCLLRYFFYVHRDKQPVPQIIAALAFGVLTNLTARVMGGSWFWIADIVQYALAATLALTVVIGRYKRVRQEKEFQKTNGITVTPMPVPHPISDFFDSQQKTIVWVVSVFVSGLIIYGYVKAFNEKQVVAIQENTRVTAEYARDQHESEQEREAILVGVASVSATQQTVLSGLQSLSQVLVNSQKEAKQVKRDITDQVNAKTAPIRQIAKGVDSTRRDMKEIKNRIRKETPEKAKSPFWKKWFSAHGSGDTTYMARSLFTDTLANH